ncbi:structural phage protein [Leifsonia xyli subsp. cynodontis DSM 46306]|uniref:Peptidoglycan binding-like domain-containing protein n=1 Tax=Leifsonia xyli subsp. cynodontis DSM 46306 TaxID=1389489 RepID=U3PAG3_LEIXC|nr:peptidoglycan-binding domain-containing protein [Leifsonia xyli]AGW40443.1 structural phage protein [Leifsonia xyli subsp. cynodontis DSM 46306]
MPAFQSFESGMTNGPDIAALEASLKKLGFLTREPGNRFTGSTAEAIKRWQKATGQETTGAIPFGTVVFASGPVRVGEAKAHLGDQVGGGGALLDVTDTAKRVDVDVKLSDQSVAAVGGKVGVDLPGG